MAWKLSTGPGASGAATLTFQGYPKIWAVRNTFIQGPPLPGKWFNIVMAQVFPGRGGSSEIPVKGVSIVLTLQLAGVGLEIHLVGSRAWNLSSAAEELQHAGKIAQGT